MVWDWVRFIHMILGDDANPSNRITYHIIQLFILLLILFLLTHKLLNLCSIWLKINCIIIIYLWVSAEEKVSRVSFERWCLSILFRECVLFRIKLLFLIFYLIWNLSPMSLLICQSSGFLCFFYRLELLFMWLSGTRKGRRF